LKSGGNIHHRYQLSLERRNREGTGKCFIALLLATVDVEAIECVVGESGDTPMGIITILATGLCIQLLKEYGE
jgi:hypothetical protein